ncbi:CYTH domain-containing protein [Vagococcus zengguangii]|uniref:CYTH domain-containing protein n=1 Tax=Vagococcus zengguangii TaxID=2571750 RepID=A0A4D7CVB8_9ENTE|nr:CYTH domain-containing protein [Vagococcus zengguangii]QCI87142.1 CYTH domain-containing protein [Vagococcus zengguangii]TLG80646.1 CYTH domain-containing protein [Vagococcus zengguangii]
MPEQIEIEFKNLLSENEYHELFNAFKMEEIAPIVQENIYLDTPDFQLKKHHAALRVRVKANNNGEITLKTPLPQGLLETNIPLTPSEVISFMETHVLPIKDELETKLTALDISQPDVHVFASLKTKRLEKKLSSDILLVLDESWYHGQHDYELEVEASSYDSGKQFFESLLQNHHIQTRPTPNKIQRAMNAT